MRILIIEDDRQLACALAHILSEAGYDSHAVHNGADGYFAACSGGYDLILLDVMLPCMDGRALVRRLRAEHITVPAIMLTALGEVSDRVSGLDAGADDYLTKPFAPDELLARIRALLRRNDPGVPDGILRVFDIELDIAQHVLQCGERSVQLSAREFQLMHLLMNSRGHVLPKELIIEHVWGENPVNDNTVEVYISFLRKKLSHVSSRTSITTLRQIGYRMEAENEC